MGMIRRHWRAAVLWLIAMLLLGLAAVNNRDGVIVFFLPAVAGILTLLLPFFLGAGRVARLGRRKIKRQETDRIERLLGDLEDEIGELETALHAREHEAPDRDEPR